MDKSALKRIALNNLNILHTKCTRGIYTEKLFKSILRNIYLYEFEELKWMYEFVNSPNELIALNCLEVLCSSGASISEFSDLIKDNFDKRQWCHKFIELAEKQNDPDSLLFFLEEDGIYINRAILALKRNKQETYLTALMLSDDENLVKAVVRIIDK